jgi:hypothetical protein
MTDTIVTAYAYENDAEHILLVYSSGQRRFHVLGGFDVETEEAYQEFLRGGGTLTPPRRPTPAPTKSRSKR